MPTSSRPVRCFLVPYALDLCTAAGSFDSFPTKFATSKFDLDESKYILLLSEDDMLMFKVALCENEKWFGLECKCGDGRCKEVHE